jgi:hypothetical protein
MMRKFLGVLALGALLASSAPAGHPDMAEMKADFAKCMICKNMVPHADTLFPVMNMEIVKLNDGVALVHTVSDPAQVATYHAMHDAMAKAGEASMALTDEQAKTQLCGFCNEIRGLMKAGASMHIGPTKNGDIMAITSADAPTQAKIAMFESHVREMHASHDGHDHEG